MDRMIAHARGLSRHWLIQARKAMSLVTEYLTGWLRAILWMPVLPLRYFQRLRRSQKEKVEQSSRFDEPVVESLVTKYINLRYREDRNQQARIALESVGLDTVERFEAIQNPIGALGCALSHVAVLESLLRSEVVVALVCEDDIEFVGNARQLATVLEDFMRRPELDVLCLSYRLRGPSFPIGKHLALGNNIQTTAGYVVKQSALEPLIRSFKQSAALLEVGAPISSAAIDIKWKELQFSRLFFCIPRVPIAQQRQSYSDIAGKVKFYG